MNGTILDTFAGLDDLVARSVAHPERVGPLYSALCVGCDLWLQPQDSMAYSWPVGTRGSIIVIEDDVREKAVGPEGFDADSLERFAPGVERLAILAHGPCAGSYEAAAETAIRGGWALVVETRPEHELTWQPQVVLAASRLEADPRTRSWRIHLS